MVQGPHACLLQPLACPPPAPPSRAQGRALVGTEATNSVVSHPDGGSAPPMAPSLISTVYIYPGVALGTLISRSAKTRDEQFIAAAEAVGRLVTDEDRAAGACLPPLHKIRDVAAHVARWVGGWARAGVGWGGVGGGGEWG